MLRDTLTRAAQCRGVFTPACSHCESNPTLDDQPPWTHRTATDTALTSLRCGATHARIVDDGGIGVGVVVDEDVESLAGQVADDVQEACVHRGVGDVIVAYSAAITAGRSGLHTRHHVLLISFLRLCCIDVLTHHTVSLATSKMQHHGGLLFSGSVIAGRKGTSKRAFCIEQEPHDRWNLRACWDPACIPRVDDVCTDLILGCHTATARVVCGGALEENLQQKTYR